jgi:hypothetical protein
MEGLNHIVYNIQARLSGSPNTVEDQIIEKMMNIREPPRSPPHPLKKQVTCSSRCCCANCGWIVLALETNVTHIAYELPFIVRGTVDNQNSKILIKNYKIVLRELTIQIN